jgi:hypothetical protein
MATLTHASGFISSDHAVSHSQTGINLAAAHGALRDLLRAAIAQHGGVVDWTLDHTGWVVTLHLPEERTFCGRTLEESLAACLAWLLTPAG